KRSKPSSSAVLQGGVVTRRNLLEDWVARMIPGEAEAATLQWIIAYDLIHRAPITVQPWESCRAAAEVMIEKGVGRLVVVSEADPGKVVGIVTRSDLLKPRANQAEEESKRERFLGVKDPRGAENAPA